MRRATALLAAFALVAGIACGGGGGDDDLDVGGEDETPTTAQGEDLAALNDEGADVFGDYITALLGGNYQVAMENATGAASAVAGYFNGIAQIKSVPAEFKPPNRQVKLSFNGDRATRNSDGTITLSDRVEADITGGGADEKTTYTDIKLREEKGKLQVVDFVRGDYGPVSEDVYRTDSSKGEGNGIEVTMGPGFGTRGTLARTEGRVQLFTTFVFAFTNKTQYQVNIKETTDQRLYNAASLSTADELYPSDSSYGTTAAPGARGFGFLYFKASVEGDSGILTLRFVDEDDDEHEVKVPLNDL